APECLEVLEGLDENLLRQVQGVLAIADEAEAERVHLALVARHQLVEGPHVAAQVSRDERAVGVAVRARQGQGLGCSLVHAFLSRTVGLPGGGSGLRPPEINVEYPRCGPKRPRIPTCPVCLPIFNSIRPGWPAASFRWLPPPCSWSPRPGSSPTASTACPKRSPRRSFCSTAGSSSG